MLKVAWRMSTSFNEVRLEESVPLLRFTFVNWMTPGWESLNEYEYPESSAGPIPWDRFPEVSGTKLGDITESDRGITLLILLQEGDLRVPQSVKVTEERKSKTYVLAEVKFRLAKRAKCRIYFARLLGLNGEVERVNVEVSLELPPS